jgi:hypothetical protein
MKLRFFSPTGREVLMIKLEMETTMHLLKRGYIIVFFNFYRVGLTLQIPSFVTQLVSSYEDYYIQLGSHVEEFTLTLMNGLEVESALAIAVS